MPIRPVSPSYSKHTSPFGGTTRSSFSASNSYVKTSAPFCTRRTYANPSTASYSSYVSRPWNFYRPAPVVIYDTAPTIPHYTTDSSSHSNAASAVLAGVFLTVIALAVLNHSLSKDYICQMVQDCNDITNICSGPFEQCSRI